MCSNGQCQCLAGHKKGSDYAAAGAFLLGILGSLCRDGKAMSDNEVKELYRRGQLAVDCGIVEASKDLIGIANG